MDKRFIVTDRRKTEKGKDVIFHLVEYVIPSFNSQFMSISELTLFKYSSRKIVQDTPRF